MTASDASDVPEPSPEASSTPSAEASAEIACTEAPETIAVAREVAATAATAEAPAVVPTAEPTGIAPLQSVAALGQTPRELPALFLEFESTEAEPQLEKIFLGTGGSIAAAAARGLTDFALSGSEHATATQLSDAYSTVVRVPVPADMVSPHPDRPMTAVFPNHAKLLVSSSRVGASINGSLVTTVAGQGAVYLPNLFGAANGSAQVPLTYANWAAHSSVVAACNTHLVDAVGRKYNVHFQEHPEADAALEAAEKVVTQWANGAWEMRQTGMRYPHAPTLTKSVARVPCGINDSGYNLVGNVVEMRVPYSWPTINSMMESAVQVDLQFHAPDIAKFLGETKMPGIGAARWGRTIAASLSTLGNLLVSYRADGRTRVTPEGSDVVAAESWLDQAPRDPFEGNDCDGSAILISSLARAIVNAPAQVLKEYEYIGAAKNTIFPYYTVGVSVLGAMGAEASGGGTASADAPRAGHAACIMMQTLSLLQALQKGGDAHVGGAPVLAPDMRGPIAEARFDAMFPAHVLATLPHEDRVALSSKDAKTALSSLEVGDWALEGTTLAEPCMYAVGDVAAKAAANAERDTEAFQKVAPNIARSLKILHVGGHNPQNTHKFYAEFVEFNLGSSHPFWTDAKVRDLGAATTQLVFGKEPSRITGAIPAAGASPRELVTKSYTAVPLVTTNTETAALLDYASKEAAKHVMPPRPPVAKLTPFLSEQLTRSLGALASLDEALKGNDDAAGHPVAYMLAYSTLVQNPRGVEHLCSRLRAVAAAGVVDSLEIKGLATDHNGAEAGRMVFINVIIPYD